jgi:type I restriction-modification system DNA methylase subunit
VSAPREISDLVEHFARNEESYRSGQYNETMVRREFIDPFFKCLGWDIDNTLGFAEAYKDVIHEDAIKIGGVTKAPDYCFRVGGTRKFFLEAKRPSVNLKLDPEPAFQLRRYAWSAKLPLSILTDFEEFAVYDCRVKPAQSDKAAAARIRYLTYTDYAEQWDSLAASFSKDAVLKGSFDKYAETSKLKKGTATVDAAFLKEIEGWRDLLAKNIALRNPDLSQRELNYAVQVTIDRILFLRMCEDRGVEQYGQLGALQNGLATYARLRELYRKADDRYNSGLFHFTKEKERSEPPDELTAALAIDDKPLKEILKSLYYPESPYEFSVLPAEILGQVYEQFLGKVIRLTAGHRAVVEEKPEVRKAGGVYYTPTYIVDYIVKNTVGKLLDGKTPRQAAKLKVLDPACGSGSFLLGAYQYLLDWHRDRYVAAGTAKPAKEIFQGRGGAWHLTSAEKKRILLNNIHGVDIDPQAVEVTKLSLLLKVLEGESQQTLERNLSLFHERALPDLGSNIKCGNSLIGPDFYDNEQLALFDEEERYRINVFDWQEAFPQIMKSGGFDAVIGNPPYVRMEGFKELKSYLRANYKSHDERSDIYVYFMERAHARLRLGGKFGMIVSNKFIRANYGSKLRKLLASAAAIEEIVDLAGLPVFRGATVRTVVFISTKGGSPSTTKYTPPLATDIFQAVDDGRYPLAEAIKPSTYEIPTTTFAHDEWLLSRPEMSTLLRRLRTCGEPLASVVAGKICMGIKSGLAEAFIIDREQRDRILSKNPAAEAVIRPFGKGRDIRRFYVEPREEYLIYTPHGIDVKNFPAILDHLRPFKDRLEARATEQAWYELQQPQFAHISFLEQPKIVFPDMAISCRFALDRSGIFGDNTVYFLPTDDSYLLGLLNSKMGQFYFVQTCAALEGPGESYLRFFGQYLENFPVRRPTTLAETKQRDRIAALVDLMLALHKQLSRAKAPHSRTSLETQIATTDRQIDKLVYELYGLTPDEIKIVEQDRNEPAMPPDADEDTAAQDNGAPATYTPYQPALDAGISEEMDRVNFRRLQLVEREVRGELTPEEKAELEHLQETFFAYVETIFPRSWILDDDRLEKLEQKYKNAKNP